MQSKKRAAWFATSVDLYGRIVAIANVAVTIAPPDHAQYVHFFSGGPRDKGIREMKLERAPPSKAPSDMYSMCIFHGRSARRERGTEMKLELEKEDAKLEAAEVDELEPITIGGLVELTGTGPSPGTDDTVIWGT